MKICLPVATSKTQYFINQAYTKYISECGFEPVLVTHENDAIKVAEQCDGLLLPGGIDLDPIFYGEDNIASYTSDPIMDDYQRQLLYAFIGQNKKIFGICRGFQLIVREFLHHNEEFEQELVYYQEFPGHSIASKLSVLRSQPTHRIKYKPNLLYGEKDNKVRDLFVNSMHHQAIMTEGMTTKKKVKITYGQLTIAGWTEKGVDDKEDGYVIEAVVIDSGGGIKAVQWHPEEMMDTALLISFFGDKKEDAPQAETPESDTSPEDITETGD